MFFGFISTHVQDAHHSMIDDSEIIVDYNRQQLMPGWIPRRLGIYCNVPPPLSWSCQLRSFDCSLTGGGLGGKKESGQLRFGGRERPFRAPLYEHSSLVKQYLTLCITNSDHLICTIYFEIMRESPQVKWSMLESASNIYACLVL